MPWLCPDCAYDQGLAITRINARQRLAAANRILIHHLQRRITSERKHNAGLLGVGRISQ